MNASPQPSKIRFDLSAIPMPVGHLPRSASGHAEGVFDAWNELFAAAISKPQELTNWLPAGDLPDFLDLLQNMAVGESKAWHIAENQTNWVCRASALESGWLLMFEAPLAPMPSIDSLSHSAMDGIARIEDLMIVDCNERFGQIMGATDVAMLKNRDLTEWLSIRDWRRLQARSKSMSPCEIELEIAPGNFRFVEAAMKPIGPGEATHLFIYDVTDHKRVERDLAQTKERFRLLVESNPISLFLVIEGQIQYVNPAATELVLADAEDELIGASFETLFINSDRDRIRTALLKARQGEKVPYVELTLELEGHVLRDVGLRMTLSVFDRQPAIQVTATDLSTRMELMREQMRASLAEETNELLKAEINRHQATQRKLRETEELNRSIIESSIDMIAAFDEDGRLLQFNHAASVEFGWSVDEAKTLEFSAFLADPDEADGILHELRTHNYFVGEVAGIRASGEEFSMLMSVATLRSDEGARLGAVVVARDITDLKLAEEELRESEHRYRDILEHATDLIFLLSPEGHFTYANPSFFRTLGYAGMDLADLPVHSIIQGLPEERNAWMDALESSQHELQFKAHDGSVLQVIGGATAQHDDAGNRIGLRGIYLDITDMRRHERAARVQSAKLESIFNSTRYLLMFTIDGEMRLTSQNENFASIMRLQFGDDLNLGDSVLDKFNAVMERDLDRDVLQFFPRAFDGRQQQFEMPVRDVEGNLVWFQMFLNPVQFDDDHKELSCIAYDITERKEIDDAIRNALKEKEVLLQEVHHRVKNNLQVISSMLNLQRRFIKDPGLLQVLDESQNRIATMSYIHESLYRNTDFSSISFSEYLVRLSNNLIHSYARQDCQVELRTVLDDVHLKLDQAIPCGLIVNELVSNAMKYAFVSRPFGCITLRVQRVRGDLLEIEVQDDGVGLPEGFDFSQNDSLGVYLVQALTDQIDGTLLVRNNENGPGCSFLVSFTPST